MPVSLNVNSSPPAGHNGSLTISKIEQGTVSAPAGVWFSVDLNSLSGFVDEAGNPIAGPTGGDVYDKRFHEVTYIWDFDDPGTFDTPLNIPTIWNNKNVAYGAKVAHAFSAPGTYNVEVWAIDTDGNTGVAAITVTVIDADTAYPGARTIYFDPTSTWADSPAGAAQVSTVAALQTTADALTQTGRILIARGTSQADFSIDLEAELVEYIGARGTGARPVLTCPNVADTHMIDLGTNNTIDQMTITGLSMQGPWDSTVAGGGAPVDETEPVRARVMNGTLTMLIYDCDFSGFKRVNMTGDREFVTNTMMIDCSITNWEDYGLYLEQVHLVGGFNRSAVAGCSIIQDVDAQMGDNGKTTRDNEHGPIRAQQNQEMYFACLDLFSNNGWAGGQATPSVQPCIRTNTNGVSDQFANFDRICGENGGEAVFIGNPENASQQNLPNNYVYDKMLAVGGAVSRTGLFEHSMGGVTFRNCLGIIPNVPSEYPNDFLQAHNGFKCIPDNSGTGNNAAPIRIRNCSIVNLRNTTNDAGFTQEFSRIQSFTSVSQQNNVLHAPSMDTPVTTSAPIDIGTSIAGFTPRFKGIKFTGQGSLQTQFANPSTVPLARPQSGSAAFETGTDGLTHDDLLMVARGRSNGASITGPDGNPLINGAPSSGALEPT